MIGVNLSGNEPQKLKQVVEKEKLNWRNLADPSERGFGGAITKTWNISGTPTMYLLDHRGVIRHKWVGAPGATAIDEALEPLIEEASRQ